MNSSRIVPARPEWAGRLTEIAHAAKAYWGYPPQWLALWRQDLTITPAAIRNLQVFVALAGDDILGFYALAKAARPKASLEHLWVVPEAIGQGLGRALFEHAVRQATAAGATLLVVESDPNAEGFYRRMGARTIGERCYELDGQPRSLPILALELTGARPD